MNWLDKITENAPRKLIIKLAKSNRKLAPNYTYCLIKLITQLNNSTFILIGCLNTIYFSPVFLGKCPAP